MTERRSRVRRLTFTIPRLVLAAALLCGPAASAQTAGPSSVDEIVAKHLAAKGGVEKLRGVTSVRTTGRVRSGRGVSTITVWTRRPNSLRQEMTTDGKTGITGFDGTTLWAINPLLGATARELSGPAADRAREEAEDFDSVLLDFQQKGHTVELVPGADASAPPHLRVMKKNGKIQDIYLDPATFLEQRTTTQVSQGGKTVIVSNEFSNYKPVDGIMVPFTIRQSVGGQLLGEVVYDRVQFNLPLADELFKMPAK
jgi:outer membrane lipoprotein-sorting protein